MFKRTILLFACIFIFLQTRSATYDNKFFPFHVYVFPRIRQKPSEVNINAFFITGDDAQGRDNTIGLPELCGLFDQKQLGEALVAVGLPNPLRPDFQLLPGIPWGLCGKITGQGIGFNWEQQIKCNWWMGVSFSFLHASSYVDFVLDDFLARDLQFNAGKEGDLFELDRELRLMLQEIGLQSGQWSKSGVTDIDFYTRLGNFWDYVWRLRRVWASLKVGVLGPAGVPRDINNPASIPFDGNKHAGFYLEGDLELELKEDIFFGMLARITKRKTKCKKERFSVVGEPPIFGALVAEATVDPGLGVAFSAYLTMQDIRDGFGAQLRYTIATVREAKYRNVAIEDETMRCNAIARAEACSSFKSEYFSLNVFYDFNASSCDSRIDTKLFFAWDKPIDLIAGKDYAKTNRVALGFQVNY